MLALDAVDDAHCKGIALAVEAGHEERTLAELRERELISSAYLERDLARWNWQMAPWSPPSPM